MITFLLILALIVAVAAVVFALQNTIPITVTFFVWQFAEKPLALILLLALAAGVLIGLLTILPGSIKNKWRSSSMRKRIDSLEKNLQETQQKLEQARLEITTLQQQPEPPAPVTPPVLAPEPTPPTDQPPTTV